VKSSFAGCNGQDDHQMQAQPATFTVSVPNGKVAGPTLLAAGLTSRKRS
jgi:hypothetical protein